MTTHDTPPPAKRPKVTRAEAQRVAKAAQQHLAAPSPLPADLETYLVGYEPNRADKADWEAVRETFVWVMRRCGITGATSFRHHCCVVAGYLMWRHSRCESVAVGEAFTHGEVGRYCRQGLSGHNPDTALSYHSKLKSIASKVNPGPASPPKVRIPGHNSVQPGYTVAEMAAICRVAERLHAPKARRQVCAIVGLAAGAGLSPEDMRNLRRRHIDDRGDDGIIVNVPGKRRRTTVVLRDYEDLVRIGVEGLGESSLVLGTKAARKNITGNIIADAPIHEDLPPITAWRLRSTWICHHMTNRVPLAVLLKAAGLTSARTLTDLMKYLPDTAADPSGILRGAE